MRGDRTPADLGYRLVGESEPMARYWLAWPRAGEDAARDAVRVLAELLSDIAAVTILANPAEVAEVSLNCPPGVTAMAIRHDGSRLKAQGPLFLRRPADGAVAALAPASPPAADLLGHLGCPWFGLPPWLRADQLDTDGAGVLLASRALLDGRGQAGLEGLLRDLTGAEKVVWLDAGPAGPDRALAAVARCLAPRVAMAMVEEDRSGGAYTPLRDNLERLADAGMAVVGVPLPARRSNGRSGMPAAYTDCVVTAGGVVLPAFEESRDEVALAAVARWLPDRPVLLQPARELLTAGYDLSGLVLAQPAAAKG